MEKEEILSVNQYTKFLVPASSYNMTTGFLFLLQVATKLAL